MGTGTSQSSTPRTPERIYTASLMCGTSTFWPEMPSSRALTYWMRGLYKKAKKMRKVSAALLRPRSIQLAKTKMEATTA